VVAWETGKVVASGNVLGGKGILPAPAAAPSTLFSPGPLAPPPPAAAPAPLRDFSTTNLDHLVPLHTKNVDPSPLFLPQA
jgi:hypothetical protein